MIIKTPKKYKFVITVLLIIGVLGGASAPQLRAQTLKPTFLKEVYGEKPSMVRAALLLNIPKFIKWPENIQPKDKYIANICIYGALKFSDDILKQIEDRLQYKPNFRNIESLLNNNGECHIVYITDTTVNNEAIHYLHKRNVFTVSDANGFVDKGGIMQFIQLQPETKVRYNLNLKAINQSGLIVNNDLITFANKVAE